MLMYVFFFFVIDQKVLLPVFLPENHFFTSGTGSRVETGSEPAPELPQWKRGHYNCLRVGNRDETDHFLTWCSWKGCCSHTWSTHFAALVTFNILSVRVALGLSGGQHLMGNRECLTYTWIKNHLEPQFSAKCCFSLWMTVGSLPHTDCLSCDGKSLTFKHTETHWHPAAAGVTGCFSHMFFFFAVNIIICVGRVQLKSCVNPPSTRKRKWKCATGRILLFKGKSKKNFLKNAHNSSRCVI